jgi:hypothetical protein
MAEEYNKKIAADGSITESRSRDGVLHCDNSPAFIERFKDGSVYTAYFYEGKRHRDNGPAVILERSDGSVYREYYLHGKRIPDPPVVNTSSAPSRSP